MDERFEKYPVIVFDIGNVLLRFDPKILADRFLPEASREKLYHGIFESGLWHTIDYGIMEQSELARLMCEAAHTDRREDFLAVMDLMLNFPEAMAPLPLSRELPGLKKAGKKLYFLTDYSSPQIEKTFALNPFFELFDGGVISSHEHMVKPSPRIFELLCERYGFKPQDALFIDDTAGNVQSAARLGFGTWHYTDVTLRLARV